MQMQSAPSARDLKGLLVVENFFERTPNGPILVGSKCRECGKVYFPKKKVCHKCFRNDCLDIRTSRLPRGRVLLRVPARIRRPAACPT